jgi:hypothetical protein
MNVLVSVISYKDYPNIYKDSLNNGSQLYLDYDWFTLSQKKDT